MSEQPELTYRLSIDFRITDPAQAFDLARLFVGSIMMAVGLIRKRRGLAAFAVTGKELVEHDGENALRRWVIP